MVDRDSEPVLENPPELGREEIERVVELTGFARDRVKTVIEVAWGTGLSRVIKAAVTSDLTLILCALHGLSRERINEARHRLKISF